MFCGAGKICILPVSVTVSTGVIRPTPVNFYIVSVPDAKGLADMVLLVVCKKCDTVLLKHTSFSWIFTPLFFWWNFYSSHKLPTSMLPLGLLAAFWKGKHKRLRLLFPKEDLDLDFEDDISPRIKRALFGILSVNSFRLSPQPSGSETVVGVTRTGTHSCEGGGPSFRQRRTVMFWKASTVLEVK